MTVSTRYDCIVVGGGVSGTALLYQLARFTNLKHLLLAEKSNRPAQANSHACNNSQTLRHGDIESERKLDQALAVKRSTSMLINYASKRPAHERDQILHRMPRMLLGIGERECDSIRQRYQTFRHAYPDMQLFDRQDIADIEPNVALVDGTWRHDQILALGTPNAYSAVDFQALSESFSGQCVRMDRDTKRYADKQVTQLYSTEVSSIHKQAGDYVLTTNRGPLRARSVVVCASGDSLPMAQSMGLGLDYACLPVTNAFFLAPEALNGKVYRLHNPRLPFTAMHGDRDIKQHAKTRFGPSALLLPLSQLARSCPPHGSRQRRRIDRNLAATLWDLFQVGEIRDHTLRNLLYRVPILNRRLFVREVQQIVPDIQARDIEYAEQLGGIRAQVIDREAGKLTMGEVRISDGQGVIFNLTSLSGGSGCLGDAERDMRLVTEQLGARIDWDAFEHELLTNEDSREAPLSAFPSSGREREPASCNGHSNKVWTPARIELGV
jgi:malate dehydrogenase (quinone)